jgi:uncharacterized protein
MFISAKEMHLGKVRFHETFEPGAIELFDEQLRQVTPLEADGAAELVPSLMEIRVKGHLKVQMEAQCDRCLETTTFPIDTGFDLFYQPARSLGGEEIQIDDADSDIGFYQGDSLDLADVLREQILLSLPMQRICREDCKGICPVCGQNRNQIACGCHPQLADDRWSKLRNL